jgi:hypothetical protein
MAGELFAAFVSNLAQHLEHELTLRDGNFLDFVFEDNLLLTVSPHPDEMHLVMDMYVKDCGDLTGEEEDIIYKTLLRLNFINYYQSGFHFSLDKKSYLVLSLVKDLRQITPAQHLDIVSLLLTQARLTRELISILTLKKLSREEAVREKMIQALQRETWEVCYVF